MGASATVSVGQKILIGVSLVSPGATVTCSGIRIVAFPTTKGFKWDVHQFVGGIQGYSAQKSFVWRASMGNTSQFSPITDVRNLTSIL
jgi:hypothetical protein